MDLRENLIQQLSQAHQAMQRAIANIDPQFEIYTDWKLKELLAHLTGWDDATIASLSAFLAGDPPATPAARGFDLFNAQSVAGRQTLSLEHVTKEWHLARQQLIDLIRQVPDGKQAETFVFPWGDRGDLAQITQILADHELEHANEIQALWAKDSHAGPLA